MARRTSSGISDGLDGVDSLSILGDAASLLGDDADPSLGNGFQLYYEREVPFELRSTLGSDNREVGALETIRVRIFVQGEQASPKAIRVELSCERNLFFHYTHEINAASFRQLQESQRLTVSFHDYPAVLMRNLNSCVREPNTFLAVLVVQLDGSARLDFIQNMEYKYIELLSCAFEASPDEYVRQQVTWRYDTMKARAGALQARLAEVLALVKLKSPSVLLQLQRTPSKGAPGSLSPAGSIAAASPNPGGIRSSSGGALAAKPAFY